VSPRRARYLLTVVLVLTAGCVGTPLGSDGPSGESPASPGPTAATPFPGYAIDFPDGPKELPERPTPLNGSSVRDYTRTVEYRYAYNSLWYGAGSEVSVDCTVDSVTKRSSGYAAVVTCTGYSNTRGTASGTVTGTVLHADWGSRTARYRVTENATDRRVEG
jgi:hypothetical protein